MNRTELLERAAAIVTGERANQYGDAENNFAVIADMWCAYLQGCGVNIDFLEPADVAAMMILLKVARIASGHAKDDNWVDIAGYAACGAEMEDNNGGV